MCLLRFYDVFAVRHFALLCFKVSDLVRFWRFSFQWIVRFIFDLIQHVFIGENVSMDLEATRGRIQSNNCWHDELPAGLLANFFVGFLWFIFHVICYGVLLSANKIAREICSLVRRAVWSMIARFLRCSSPSISIYAQFPSMENTHNSN